MKRFFKDFFIYGFASIFGKMAAVFLIPVYTSILTKEEYGAMAMITAFKGIIDLFSNLNIHSGISRDYYEIKDDRKRLVSTGLISILTCAFIVLCIISAFSHFITDDLLEIPKYYWAFMVMAMSIPAGSTMSYFSILTRYKKKPTLFTVGNILQLIIQIGISIVGVVVLRKGIISIFIGILCGEIFSILYFGYINRSDIGITFKKEYLYKALKFSIPTLPAILAGWLDSSLGQVLIGKYVSMAELGVYSLALSLSSVFTLVSTAFQNVWSPFLYENYNKSNFNNEAKKLFATFCLALILITISVSTLAPELILLLSNRGYLDASIYFPLLCIPMSVYLLFPFASSGVSISRDTKYIGISYVGGSLLNVVLMFLLLQHLSILAVPIALCASRIFTFFFLYVVSNKKIELKLPIDLIGVLTLVAVFIFLLNYYKTGLLTRVCTFVCLSSLVCCYIQYRYNYMSVIRLQIIELIHKRKKVS